MFFSHQFYSLLVYLVFISTIVSNNAQSADRTTGYIGELLQKLTPHPIDHVPPQNSCTQNTSVYERLADAISSISSWRKRKVKKVEDDVFCIPSSTAPKKKPNGPSPLKVVGGRGNDSQIENCGGNPECNLEKVLEEIKNLKSKTKNKTICLRNKETGHITVKCEQAGKKIVFKYNKDDNPTSSLLEATFGELYRPQLGRNAAKGALVKDKENNIVGTISYFDEGGIFIDFQELKSLIADKKKFKQRLGLGLGVDDDKIANKLISQLQSIIGQVENGLSDVLVSAFYYMEDDLHQGNFGVLIVLNPDPEKIKIHVYRIDFDLSMTPISSKVQRGHGRGENLGRTPEFPITETNLLNFPKTENTGWFNPCRSNNWVASVNQVPRSWRGDTRIVSLEESNEYCALSENQEFQEKKWESFMKLALIPDEYYDELLDSAMENCKDLGAGCHACKESIEQTRKTIKDRSTQLKRRLQGISEFSKSDGFLCRKLCNSSCEGFSESLFASYFHDIDKKERGLGIKNRNRSICTEAVQLTDNRCSLCTNKFMKRPPTAPKIVPAIPAGGAAAISISAIPTTSAASATSAAPKTPQAPPVAALHPISAVRPATTTTTAPAHKLLEFQEIKTRMDKNRAKKQKLH
ncbi:MAG: hypothetical protein HQK53_03505 [Oligoflexia bacterium]|nr:hypothetical protein [Oligoflexia bacterium]